MFVKRGFPRLPLRAQLAHGMPDAEHSMPDSLLDALGYSDFLDAALAHGETALAEFRAVLGGDPE
jgi:hypothetical protein